MFNRFVSMRYGIQFAIVAVLVVSGLGISPARGSYGSEASASSNACLGNNPIFLPFIRKGGTGVQVAADGNLPEAIAQLELPISANQLYTDTEPADAASSPGTISVGCVALNTFNPVTKAVDFTVSGASYAAGITGIMITRNGFRLDEFSGIQIVQVGNTVEVKNLLEDGRNDIGFLALDSNGLALGITTTIFAGANDLTVMVLDENGQPFSGAEVTASAADLQDVAVVHTTNTSGQVVFINVPDTTVLLNAMASGNRVAMGGVTGTAITTTLTLQAFQPPSPINNNDFSLGLDGWNTGTAPVTLIPHAAATGVQNAPEADMDLQLNTSGEGPQSISRTFNVTTGTRKVTVRYRFITSEVPGGYFGTKYNDYFSVQIRSQNGGGLVAENNSMNGLGLAAFDASGATAWRETSLDVGQAGDIIQVDITVANVADDLYDSQVVVDLVEEKGLKVSVDKQNLCVNETVTFTGDPAGNIQWTGGGDPTTGTGTTFITRFSTYGDRSVQGTLTQGTSTSSDSASVHIKEPSGAQWVARFPGSSDVSDLSLSFSSAASNFISALQTATATVTVNATYRPAERAYLMHYAFMVANNQIAPSAVPDFAGVDICWKHYDTSGNLDDAAARAAAAAMVSGYGIVYAPALVSRHTQREAVDMNISWTGDLTIVDGNGTSVTITSTPRTGADNIDLRAVGSSYGVNKLASDAPHWSSDGH
jgi:hypothetical protein